MYSMTGIGVATGKSKVSDVQVTVKAINGRFLDLRVVLPNGFEHLESEIRKKVSTQLKRGTISVVVERTTHVESTAKINVKLAKNIYSQFKKLGQELKSKSEFSLESLLKVPDMIQYAGDPKLVSADSKIILKTVETALNACVGERKREGQGITQILKQHLSDLKGQAQLIMKNAHPNESEMKEKLSERLERLGMQGEVDQTRFAQEVIMQLEKLDVSEESERILEHIKGMDQAIGLGEPVGKRLDFYTQELFREFNTVGSKSQDAEITRIVIDSKVTIERLREQVQNIE